MKTRINIVEQWAMVRDASSSLLKCISIGYRVDEFDESFEPHYLRVSMTFATRPDAEKFARSIGGLVRPA